MSVDGEVVVRIAGDVDESETVAMLFEPEHECITNAVTGEAPYRFPCCTLMTASGEGVVWLGNRPSPLIRVESGTLTRYYQYLPNWIDTFWDCSRWNAGWFLPRQCMVPIRKSENSRI